MPFTKRPLQLFCKQFGLLLAAILPIAASAQSSANEQAVWKLERTFCDDTRAGDRTAAMKLIDPAFLGWGATGGIPMHKDDLAKVLADQAASGTRVKSCDIQPVASHAVDNMVMVQYIATDVLVDRSGHATQFRNRVAHTWIQRGNSWQMLGGMGSHLPESK
jgi:Domain of unknown function (DUF4440)